MGLLVGFAPWIVYWVLVGNVPFLLALLVSLSLAVGAMIVGRVKKLPGLTFEIGTLGTFFFLTVLTLTVSKSFLERWLAPLSYAGIFAVVLVGVLIGKPFVREFANIVQPAEVTNTDLYLRITTVLTWIWVAAYGGMTASAAVPPIVHGKDATLLDEDGASSFVFYWVIPFALMGIAALVTRLLPSRMIRSHTP
ncbi:MAG: hypothetical protein U0R81_08660 [Mycobacterium sp.]